MAKWENYLAAFHKTFRSTEFLIPNRIYPPLLRAYKPEKEAQTQQ